MPAVLPVRPVPPPAPRPGCEQARARPRALAGYTLIELVMTVVIVSILAAIAIPNYTEHARRSARAEVQTLLTTAATRQTQFLVDRRRYADSMSSLSLSLPSSLTGKYTIGLATADGPPPSFSITATATGNQAKDKCPTLVLDNAGRRTPAGCW